MIPVGPIVIGLIALGRVLANQGKSTPAGTNANTKEVSRGSRNWTQDSGSAATIGLQLLFFLAWFTSGLMLFDKRPPFSAWVLVPVNLTAGLLLFPWFVTRTVFIPLGLVRLAYATAWLSRVQWRRDKPGGPLLAAALALVHDDEPSEKTLAWLDEKLHGSQKALQASDVVAMGLVEAMRGHLSEARQLMESVLQFDPRVRPVFVAKVAAHWLCADAAAEGDWARVADIADRRRWPGSTTLRLYSAIAHRHLKHELPTNAGLWFWWLFAPRKLFTFRFVSLTAGLPMGLGGSRTAGRSTGAALTAGATPLTTALQNHATLLLNDKVDTVALANAWQQVFDDAALRTHLMQRATLLGGGTPDDALQTLRSTVEAALAPLIAEVVTTEGLPPLLGEAARTRRETQVRELEDLVARLDRRRRDVTELPAIEEWRECVKLRAHYHQTVGANDASARSLGQSIIRDKLTDYAVWLYNVRLQRPLANALFRFLEVEALSVGDAESERLNKKNAACAL